MKIKIEIDLTTKEFKEVSQNPAFKIIDSFSIKPCETSSSLFATYNSGERIKNGDVVKVSQSFQKRIEYTIKYDEKIEGIVGTVVAIDHQLKTVTIKYASTRIENSPQFSTTVMASWLEKRL